MTTYDHNYFEENQTADRYVMKRLNDAELDAFENHFPLCDACMDALSVSTAMVRDLRNPEIKQVLEGEMKPDLLQASARSGSSVIPIWRRLAPMVSVAAVMLLGFVFWRMGQLEPINFQEWQTIGEALPEKDVRKVTLRVFRGESPKPVIHFNEHIRFEIPFLEGDVNPNLVRLYKREKNDVQLAEINLETPDPGKNLKMFIPKGALKPGSYYLLTSPGTIYHFEISEKPKKKDELS